MNFKKENIALRKVNNSANEIEYFAISFVDNSKYVHVSLSAG